MRWVEQGAHSARSVDRAGFKPAALWSYDAPARTDHSDNRTVRETQNLCDLSSVQVSAVAGSDKRFSGPEPVADRADVTCVAVNAGRDAPVTTRGEWAGSLSSPSLSQRRMSSSVGWERYS